MIKRVFFISLVILFCGVSGAQNIQIDEKQIPVTKLVAQGGYWKSSVTSPNSLEALEAAARFGCYASTCDVRLTSDNVCVVIVDAPAHKRLPDDISYVQLQQSDARYYVLDDYIMQYLRMINPKKEIRQQQVLAPMNSSKSKSPTKLLLNFQSCSSDKQIVKLTSQLKKILSDSRVRQVVEFCSNDLAVCIALARQFPDIPTMYLKGDLSPRELKKKGFYGGCAYDFSSLADHPQWVRDAVALEMPLWVSGIQNADDARDMASIEDSRILTDDLALVDAWAHHKTIVKLMSFNIRMSGMPDVDGDNAWDKRRKAVVRMFESEDPDVFGVQEMLPDQQKYLRNELQEYDMVGVGRDDGLDEGECMGIFYKKNRFDLLQSGTFWLSETPTMPSKGWDAACKRTVTYVQLKERKSGKKFFYFNTHLDHVGHVARQESVKLIAAKIRELVPDTNSVIILGGDMNSNLSSRIFVPLIGEKPKTVKQDGNNTVSVPESKSSVETLSKDVRSRASASLLKSCRNSSWQRDNSHTYTGYGKDRSSQIDHILATPATETLIFETVKDDFGVPYVSDHYPITLVFVLK